MHVSQAIGSTFVLNLIHKEKPKLNWEDERTLKEFCSKEALYLNYILFKEEGGSKKQKSCR